MKKLTLILATVFGFSFQTMAHHYGYATVNSYADAIVFDEMGVTFSVYPDGEFDFYLDAACSNTTISNGFVNVTFNSGYNYNPYVQYDDFGAVIQVENVPIWYDYYGRVSQIGDVAINYRNRRVVQVGGLYLHYNRRGHYAYHTGFINVWNPYFVYRPFYVAFARPVIGMCFVRTVPYRQYYNPIRFTYYRPYVNNVRPCYATIGHTYRPRGGYGQVHGRYSQRAGRGEAPVRRERTKITTAHATAKPMPNRSSNMTSTRSGGTVRTQDRTSVNSKPASSRTQTSGSAVTRSSKPVSTQTRNSSTRTTQAAQSRKPASTVNRTNTRQPSTNINSKPSSSRSNSVSSSSSRSSANTRTSQPSGTTSRTSTVQRPTTKSNSSSSRTVRSQPSSKPSSVQPRTSSRSSNVSSRSNSSGSSSRVKASPSKPGSSRSVVGKSTSNRGR